MPHTTPKVDNDNTKVDSDKAKVDTHKGKALSATHKLGIGALAGVCLILVKLVIVNFYLGQPRTVAIGGFLTMAAFVVVAAIGSLYNVGKGDDERQERDTPRRVFARGLLVPSILFALAQQGAGLPEGGTSQPVPAIPVVGLWELVEPTLHAAQPLTVQKIPLDRLRSGYADGVRLAVGRASAVSSYMYVIGKAPTVSEATAVAERVQKALSAAGAKKQAAILQIEGSAGFYVTVGGLQTKSDATETRNDAMKRVARTADADTIRLFVNGPVVDARQVAKIE